MRGAYERREAPERWRDVPGYEGRYQISTLGRVRKSWPGARKPLLLKPITKNSVKPQWHANLFDADGRQHKVPILRMVAMAFLGVPEGAVVVHRNGLHSDNTLQNVRVMSRREVGAKINYRHRCRPVVMIDEAGEIVECYRSAREAARQTGIDLYSVLARCHGRIMDEYKFIGYTFRFDDEE